MHEVPVVPKSADAFALLVPDAGLRYYTELFARARERLAGRTLWHVNSTAEGGGVAELLRSSLGYLRHGGMDARWLVIDGNAPFFAITKRIHNRLHGDLGDGGRLGSVERSHLARVSEDNLAEALELIDPGDVVVVHDPQPAGLIPGLVAHGAHVIWTCHVGIDVPNEVARSAWDFLLGSVAPAHAYTFTRQAYVWEGLDRARVALIPPCIDAFSLKNVELEPDRQVAILRAAGLVDAAPGLSATFVRADGSTAEVTARADVVEEGPLPADVPTVLQVSRWDALKDPRGVIEGFVQTPEIAEAHLVLAGPAPSSVADDPEAAAVLADLRRTWEALPPAQRGRVHLANLPTLDIEENAVIVNALQRHADVVVQKSLAEGFGLTVTEALWKERPMVAAGVGGIADQIIDGVNGRLVDPRDLTAFGNAVASLLADPEGAARMGIAGRQRVRERYLAPHYLGAYLDLILRVDG
ncbi:MAG: glycosyltransferase [Actinomycetota bacterium]